MQDLRNARQVERRQRLSRSVLLLLGRILFVCLLGLVLFLFVGDLDGHGSALDARLAAEREIALALGTHLSLFGEGHLGEAALLAVRAVGENADFVLQRLDRILV